MVTAALISFGILVAAWCVAPSHERRASRASVAVERLRAPG
jgi:hypothetical protein